MPKMARIKDEKPHSFIFQNENEQIDIEQSSKWWKHKKVSPKDEAIWCKIQDRNWFVEKKKCHHCRHKQMTMDHIATRCEALVSSEYQEKNMTTS